MSIRKRWSVANALIFAVLTAMVFALIKHGSSISSWVPCFSAMFLTAASFFSEYYFRKEKKDAGLTFKLMSVGTLLICLVFVLPLLFMEPKLHWYDIWTMMPFIGIVIMVAFWPVVLLLDPEVDHRTVPLPLPVHFKLWIDEKREWEDE